MFIIINKNKKIYKKTSIICLFIIISIYLMNFSIIGNSFAQTNNNTVNNNSTFFNAQPKAELEPFHTTINSQESLVKLLTFITKDKINDAINLLEITSKDSAVKSTPNISEVNTLFKGIPKDSDFDKRKVAQDILNRSKDFKSVFFVLPNGDIYLGEPFEDQQQLPRLNYADREWYKGVKEENKTYTSSVFMSASINAPAIAIAVPVHNTNNLDGNNKTLIGYWVGIINLQSINQVIDSLELNGKEQIIIFDNNGTELINSKGISQTNLSHIFDSDFVHPLLNNTANVLNQTELGDTFKYDTNISQEKSIFDVDVINVNDYDLIYQPVEVGDKSWIVMLVSFT